MHEDYRRHEVPVAKQWTAPQLALTTTAEGTVQAPSSTERRLIVESIIVTNTTALATKVDLKDGDGGPVVATVSFPDGATGQTVPLSFGTHGMKLSMGKNLRVVSSVAVSSILVNATGYEIHF